MKLRCYLGKHRWVPMSVNMIHAHKDLELPCPNRFWYDEEEKFCWDCERPK